MALQKVQSLVGAAGDWMAGDPLTTAVGAKISAATDEGLLMEDWGLNMEICDMINSGEEGPTQAVRAIKKRLHNSVGKSHKTAMFTLVLLETCVKNCGKAFHLLVCHKDFANELINRVITPGVEVSTAIQDKVLSLIQSWAHAFSPDDDLIGVAEVYMDLKKKGVDFPTPTDEDLLLVQSRQLPPAVSSPTRPSSAASTASTGSLASTLQSRVNTPQGGSRVHKPLKTHKPQKMERGGQGVGQGGVLTEGQLRKIQRDLEITQRNMDVMAELLTECTPGQEHPEDRRLLLDVSATCKEMQARVLELVGLVQHRELTASLLEINDQMNNQFLRYERHRNNCAASVSSSVQQPPTSTSTPLSPDSVDSAFCTDEVLTLSLPSEAANATSQPIPTLTKTGGQETDFREIEAWMSEAGGEAALLAMIGTDPKQEVSPGGEAGGEAEATTEEFDRFLQKRVEAVEAVPKQK